MESPGGRQDPRQGRLSAAVAGIGALLRDRPPGRAEALGIYLEGGDVTDLGEQLREAIRRSGLSSYALSKASGVDTAIILRFLAGERDVTLATASRLAEVFGMRLTAPKRTRRPDRPEGAS